MNSEEILRRAKSERPALTEAIDLEFRGCDDDIIQSYGVEGVIEKAYEVAEELEAEARRVEDEAAEHQAWTVMAEAIDRARLCVIELVEARPRWTITAMNDSRSSHSFYLTLKYEGEEYDDILEIRLSDHEQPEYGGFDTERQERRGESDVSIVITSGDEDLAPILAAMERIEREDT